MAAAQPFTLSDPSPATSRNSEIALVSNNTNSNVARDTAVQINGHIANEVHNWNFKNLIINYYTPLASTRDAHPVGLPGNVPGEVAPRLRPQSSTTNKLLSGKAKHSLEQNAKRGQESTITNLEFQYEALISNLEGAKGPVCGIFRADCQRNYMAKRIVTRFSLRSYFDCSADTSTVIAGENIITPTRNYVVLVTPTGEGSEQSLCRFYVVESCLERFDVLVGSDIVTNLSPSSSRQSKSIGSIRPIRTKS